MSHITIPAPPATAYYEVGSTPQTSFNITFPFFALSEVKVAKVVAGVETALAYSVSPADATQYSVTGTAADGGYSGGTVTVGGSGVSDCNVSVYREMEPSRLSDFPSGQQLIDITALNTELDRAFALLVDAYARLGRCIQISVADEAVLDASFVLPPLESRKSRALKFDATGNVLGASLYDPDASVTQASAAAASALQAQVDAAAARDLAASAKAAAESAGVTSEQEFSITLVAGTNTYTLPVGAATHKNVWLYQRGAKLRPGVDYTISNAAGPGKTLVLLVNGVDTGASAVTTSGASGAHKAGEVYWGSVVGAITTLAIGPKGISESNLADDAASTRVYQARSITGAKIATATVLGENVADGALSFSKMTTAGSTRGGLIKVGASNTMDTLTQGSKYQLLRSLGSAADPEWGSGRIPLGQITLSGTSVEWIFPAGLSDAVRELQLTIEEYSLSGSEALLIQVGSSGGYNVNGYTGVNLSPYAGGNIGRTPFSSGFQLLNATSALPWNAAISLRRRGASNTWHISGDALSLNTTFLSFLSGWASASPGLDRVRIRSTGTNTLAGTAALEALV